MRGEEARRSGASSIRPHYASPEQLALLSGRRQGTLTITRATDVWSLGLTLLEMLRGEADWKPGKVGAAALKPAGPGATVLPLIGRMLSKKPAERPTAAEVRGVDRQLEVPLYAAACVEWIWLADPDSKCIEVFRTRSGQAELIESTQGDVERSVAPFTSIVQTSLWWPER